MFAATGSPKARRRILVPILAFIELYAGFSTAAADWTQYRGPNHDGCSPDRIITKWEGELTNAIWTGSTRNGFSSFAVARGRAITQVRRSVDGFQKEVCIAFDISSGFELWSTAIDNALYDSGAGPDDGPRTTPSMDAEAVYVLSSRLKLVRLNATDGAVVWSTNLLAGYGGTLITWQNGASPLLDAGVIFLNVNSATRPIIALRVEDGQLAWRSEEPGGLTHSTPVIANIGGVRQLIFATQQSLVALEPSTGNRLWAFAYPSSYDLWLPASPVVYRDTVFIAGANGMGSCAARVSFTNGAWSTRLLWSSSLASTWMTPVCHNGYVYGQFGSSSAAPFKCVSIETGAETWSRDGFGRGGPLLVNDHLVVLTEDGTLVLIQPSPDGYVELGRFPAVNGKCWNSPAVCDGRLYLRSTSQAACYDLSTPELRLEPPRGLASGGLELAIATANGSSLSADRLPQIAILTTTNLDAPLGQWRKLTNALVLTNGCVRVAPLSATTAGGQFFRVIEAVPQP